MTSDKAMAAGDMIDVSGGFTNEIALLVANGTLAQVSANSMSTTFVANRAFTFSSSANTAAASMWSMYPPGADMKGRVVGLDFETYSATDLKVHGLARYISDPTFKVLVAGVRTSEGRTILDFVADHDNAIQMLTLLLDGKIISAHNAGFEVACLQHLGLWSSDKRVIDSAVVARAAGGGGSLAAAADQLLHRRAKMDEGLSLIKKFCIPSKAQQDSGNLEFDPWVVADNVDDWQLFLEYCVNDADLSYEIALEYGGYLTEAEPDYARITMRMNDTGWHVDVPLVEEMLRRYEDNKARALQDFRDRCGADDLNLNSYPQQKKWCADRGVKVKSFAERPLEKLLPRLKDKIIAMPSDAKRDGYEQVIRLLETKQVLGGSSLKKLQTILDTQRDGRLYDQYIHCGAGQTLRTTGRSVQMQNLKRLHVVEDMAELDDEDNEWDNTKLAENLRQVFTATDPGGRLIVGDFASVESRGLAYLANEGWKVQSFRQGDDLYKVLAAKIFSTKYDLVTKDQRQTGKVGELSCGYGAGPGAVVSFADGMGITMSEGEATKLVYDWRDANPLIVAFWESLDTGLHTVVERGDVWHMTVGSGMSLRMMAIPMPQALETIHPKARSVEMSVASPAGNIIMKRYFHGCYTAGRNIRYYRATDRKTGDVWRPTFVDQKTKQRRHYELYGGKLAGILTQSFCRELFFDALKRVDDWVRPHEEIQLVGQFHDEIVLDWKPGGYSLTEAHDALQVRMQNVPLVPDFPMAAEIKSDYRYTK